MTLALQDANTILHSVIRTIDKRVEYTATPADGDRAAVVVALSLRNRSTTVTIPVDALEAARENSMRRHQLRTTLKHALDRMLFVALPMMSTKMLRPMTQSDGFFRPPSGGRGRR